LANQEK